MSATERRAEIMRIMVLHRKNTVPLLMEMFSVSEKTIRRDIRALMLEYPLESISGNGGGICLPDWYYPNKNLLLHIVPVKYKENHKMKEIIKIPIKETLYQHQQNTCKFACERFGILSSEVRSDGEALLMEMVCGKTITSIAIAGILHQYRQAY